jgi:TolA-binding protein
VSRIRHIAAVNLLGWRRSRLKLVSARVGVALALCGSLGATGCLTLKSQHDELASTVSRLERAQDQGSEQIDSKIEEAEARLEALYKKIEEAETMLRGSQAGIGVRMDSVEDEVRELRGSADQASYVSAAVSKELNEQRADVDERLKVLESKLNEATNIPEGKSQLLAEADRLSKRKSYKNSRRLYRTYLARYPGDGKTAEVNFKIGQTFYYERDYKSALGEFYKIIQTHKDSPIVPDALYYSGLGFAKLGQCKSAIAYFKAILDEGTGAPAQYKKAAGQQVKILKKDAGDICLDRGDAGAGAAGATGVNKAGAKADSDRKKRRRKI